MKPRVLRIFSLILYLLCACTILNWKIETEQMVEIQYELRTTEESRTDTDVPLNAIFTDETGDHLYEVVDGTGWESGLRIREFAPDTWSVWSNPNRQPYARIQGGFDYKVVTSAARQPWPGEKARLVTDIDTVEDTYLALYPDGMPQPVELPASLSLMDQSGHALLLACAEGQRPFMPPAVKAGSSTISEAQRIISLTEAEAFLCGLPYAATAPVLLLFGLVLWATTCCFSLRLEHTRPLFWLNIVLIAASLAALYWCMAAFDLPTSMLPPQGLFQWRYYTEEYGQILTALEDMGLHNHVLVTLLPAMVQDAVQVLRIGLLLSLAVPLAECALVWVRRRRRITMQAELF